MSASTGSNVKRFVSLAPGSGVQSTSGSNRAQWNAMDLHIGRQQQGSGYNASAMRSIAQFPAAGGGVATGGGALAGMKVGNTGLSARNILIRRKLMERKRFDSADYAMSKNKEENSNSSRSNATDAVIDSRPVSTPYSPAQVGASVFFSALGADDTDETMDGDAQQQDVNARTMPSRSSTYTLQQAPAAAARGAASRYGNLEGPAGGALSARNILIQKKLREKKHFDSADYQLAQFKSTATASPPSSTDGNSSVDRDDATTTTTNSTASPMEIDLTPLGDPAVASINSPLAASVTMRRNMSAQMSPSVRGGKYGGLSGASELLRRTLSDKKKRFDSADYHMTKSPATARDDTSAPFYVPVAHAAKYGAVMAPPAPQAMAPASSGTKGGTSNYGKLCAANVLIRKKLKERKRFDSADYAMEKQGHHNDNDVPSSLSRDAQCMGMGNAPTAKHHESTISHQVKHIKLSEESGGWAACVSVSNTALPDGAGVMSASSLTMSKSSNTAHGDGSSRLAARNVIIQRKLAERKRFDSADYFKEAAGSRR